MKKAIDGAAKFLMDSGLLCPGAVRHIGLDTSLICDSTGFVVGHVSGWAEVTGCD
jgi:hypothetical protein